MKRIFIIVVSVLSILAISLAAVCCKLWLDKGKAEKQAAEYKSTYDSVVKEKEQAEANAAEYKSAYDSLVEANKEAEKAAEQEKAEAERAAKAYQTAYNDLVSDMAYSAVLAEKMCNLALKVWHNAIWEIDDEESDPFTKKNGKFVSDFNDALHNLFADAAFDDNYSALSADQTKIKRNMKEMLNPPAGFENAFKALENMYNAYITFTNLILNYCEGSYQSFSDEFSNADDEIAKTYRAAELYIKQE